MYSKCPPWALKQAERRQHHWLMAATTIEWSSFLHLTNSLCFSSARRHYNKTSQVRVLHKLRWKCNCSCVLSRPRNKSGSKFYKISQVLNKVMLKFSGFVFHEHNLYVFLFFYSAHRRILNIVVDVVVARHSRRGILNPWIGSLAWRMDQSLTSRHHEDKSLARSHDFSLQILDRTLPTGKVLVSVRLIVAPLLKPRIYCMRLC